MLYYRITGIKKPHVEDEERRASIRRQFAVIRQKAEEFELLNSDSKNILFLSDVTDNLVKIGVITDKLLTDTTEITDMFDFFEFEIERFTCDECRFTDIIDMLREGSRNDFIDDPDAILDRVELGGLHPRFGENLPMGENMIPEMDDSEIAESAALNLVSQTFMPEFKRIKNGRKKNLAIHPVQYMLVVEEKPKRKEVARTLLAALHKNGRLVSRRYTYIDIDPTDNYSLGALDQLFKSSKDSAIVIRFSCEPGDEGNVAVYDTECIGMVCDKIKQYKNRVLSIVCYQPGDQAMADLLANKLCTVNMVKITGDVVRKKEAILYLRSLAENNDLKADKTLFEKLDDVSIYKCPDLDVMFNEWSAAKIAKEFPQYSQIPVIEVPKQKKEKLTGYDEIQKLIGLKNAKTMVDNILNYYKAMNIFRSKGLVNDSPSRHICLTGNPGTCKTTLARLLARTFCENGVVNTGAFVECGKADLMGKYVGWSGKNVQEKFRRASGGILFLDEIFTLCEGDHQTSFASEIIATIVQEMENHRDDVIVVFAGYPDLMEDFLKTNPGLRSRIAFHIRMDDYSTDELLQISDLSAADRGMRLSPAAKEKLKVLFEDARQDPEYGAGRYVRNVIEQAKMAHISKIMNSGKDFNDIDEDELLTIQPEDIETKVIHVAETVTRRIGFAS